MGAHVKKVDELHFVFTGNFYHAFHNPIELVKALKMSSNRIKITIAGNNAAFVALLMASRINFLRAGDHFEALSLQQQADILP